MCAFINHDSSDLVLIALGLRITLKITFDSDEGVLTVDSRLFQAGQKSVSTTTLLQDISSTLLGMNPSFDFRIVSPLNMMIELSSCAELVHPR